MHIRNWILFAALTLWVYGKAWKRFGSVQRRKQAEEIEVIAGAVMILYWLIYGLSWLIHFLTT